MGFKVHTAEPRRQVELVNLGRCSICREAVFSSKHLGVRKAVMDIFYRYYPGMDQKECIVSLCASPPGKGFAIFPWI